MTHEILFNRGEEEDYWFDYYLNILVIFDQIFVIFNKQISETCLNYINNQLDSMSQQTNKSTVNKWRVKLTDSLYFPHHNNILRIHLF